MWGRIGCGEGWGYGEGPHSYLIQYISKSVTRPAVYVRVGPQVYTVGYTTCMYSIGIGRYHEMAEIFESAGVYQWCLSVEDT